MSKSTLFTILLFLLLSALVIVQYVNVSKMRKGLDLTLQRQSVLEEYVFNSYEITWKEEENNAINCALSEIRDSNYVVYLPAGLCRACFTNLLLAFQDHQIGFDRISVLSEINDMEVRAMCNARGVSIRLLNESIEGLDDIIVTRLYRGFFPLAMKYNLDRDQIFAMFVSDNHDYFPSN